MDTVIVSGAGSEEVNGTYTETDIQNGRPRYFLDGGGPDDQIYWIASQQKWVILNEGSVLYDTEEEDVEFPWLAVTWTNAEGDSPAPTVTLYVEPEPEPEPETENTFGLPAETVALITSRFGTVANFLRLRNQGQV
jgi:hypothetical protein